MDIFTFAKLSLFIRNMGFMNLKHCYEATETHPHAGGTIVSVTGRMSKTVSESGGVGPSPLWGIQEAIDPAAKDINWIRK